MMFAVIKYKGSQQIVTPEKEYNFDLISGEDAGKKIVFNEVLLISVDGKVTIGQPYIAGASVEAEILSEVKDEKTTVLKFHSKKRYQRKIGQTTKKTRIKILKINVKAQK